jgi:hypothetical protein
MKSSSVDTELSGRGDLRSVLLVGSTADFSDVIRGEARPVGASVTVAVEQVLPVISEVEVTEVHTTDVPSSTRVQHEGFTGITLVDEPHRTGRLQVHPFVPDGAQAPFGRDALISVLRRQSSEVIQPVCLHGAKATVPATVPASPTP